MPTFSPPLPEREYLHYLASHTAELAPAQLPTVAVVRAGLLIVHRCLYRSTAGCGCNGAHCALASKFVSHRDCLVCVKDYGDA